MNKPIKIAGILLIGIVLVIQLFQPERNRGMIDPDFDFLQVTDIPDSLSVILKTACFDCHSNQTRYPWYSYISPLSWYLEKHVRSGKKELNLSQFGNFEKEKMIGTLVDICDVIENGSMPLKSYLLIHRHARIDKETKEAICNWTEMEALRIMRE